MNLNEKIIAQLSAAYPDRLFSTTMEIDGFKPRVVITINGQRTNYGYHPEYVVPTDQPLDMWVANFVRNFVVTYGKDFNRV